MIFEDGTADYFVAHSLGGLICMNVCDLIPNDFVKDGILHGYIYVGAHDREQCRAKPKTDP